VFLYCSGIKTLVAEIMKFGTVKNNMKRYERNHTCLPSGREDTEIKLIPCLRQAGLCSPDTVLYDLTGIACLTAGR